MSASHIRLFREESAPAVSPAWAILASSYSSGATQGKQLGSAGYSYDFLARQFMPLLQRLGKVYKVRNPQSGLSAAIQKARNADLEPVHLSFRPFQDVPIASSVPNVVVPAWEFPDVPDAPFDGNPQNNWVETANRCSLVLAGGPFTAETLKAAGVKTPIRIVPVPTPEKYFQMPQWQNDHDTTLDCSPYVFPETDALAVTEEPPAVRRRSETMRVLGLRAYRRVVKPCFPARIEPVIAAMLHAGMATWREQAIPRPSPRTLDLGGIVYTSIFNPADDRKNWEDMITAFLQALRDCEDATLVLKLVTHQPQAVHRVLSFYRRLDVSHRCRLVVIPDFLAETDMMQLVRASSYYLTSTRAEGYCLPLMNYLAAGRPCIAPMHTAIADYFNDEMGFVVASHPEPCNWPQDSRRRWRTTRHRLVWTSLVEQIRRSHEIAVQDRAAYAGLAEAARERMLRWSHPDAVWPHLRSAMELLASHAVASPQTAESIPIAVEPAEPRAIPIESVGERRAKRLSHDGSLHPTADAKPIRAVVSLLSLRPGEIGGTETYLRQLIARLPKVDCRSEIVLLMDRDLAATNLFPGIDRAVVDLSSRQVLRARALEAVSAYRARAVEKTVERLRPDVVFFPQQSIFPKNISAPCALVVHDLYHLFMPQYLSRGQRLFRRRCYAYSIARADQIIAISQFTKKTVLQHYDVAAERIDVIPHGWETADAGPMEADPGLCDGYLYYPAITRPHKNHHILLESIAKLRSQGRFHGRLILSGIQTPHWKTLCKQIRRLDLSDTVQHAGYVSFDRVRQLYHGAQCVVFPTAFEGFGLPVIEAVESGKKILVSPLEVFDGSRPTPGAPRNPVERYDRDYNLPPAEK